MNILAKKIAVFTFLFVSLSVFAHLLKIIFYLIVPFVVFSLAYVSNFISIGVNEPQQYVYLLCPSPLIDRTKKVVNLSQCKEERHEEAETVQC